MRRPSRSVFSEVFSEWFVRDMEIENHFHGKTYREVIVELNAKVLDVVTPHQNLLVAAVWTDLR